MESGLIIALLAVFTIGIVLAIAVFHFGYFLKDPRNRGAARNALVEDGPSATTEVRPDSSAGRKYGGLADSDERGSLGTSHATTGVMPGRSGGQPPGL